MRLISVQVVECFGFRDSGTVDLSSTRGFFYVLGRNSSGKTSFLTAIRNLEVDVVPSDHPNFKNYNPTAVQPRITAYFEIDPKGLSVEQLLEALQEELTKAGINSVSDVAKRDQITENVLEGIREIYTPFLEELSKTGIARVDRMATGAYSIFAGEDGESYEARQAAVGTIFQRAAPNDQVVVPPSNTTVAVRLGGIDLEKLLFCQFPKIYFFADEFSLGNSLPDRIDLRHLQAPADDLAKSFIELLGADDLKCFLESEDPDQRSELSAILQKKVDALAAAVNFSGEKADSVSLLEFVLHPKDGIQITVKADGKKCYYRHLSDNTKFLIAYHLHARSRSLTNTIMLFDEPNKGFHPTSESFLLSFLRHLSESGNLVLVSTHSQHLIDIDLLANIKVMSSDDDNFLRVVNSAFRRARRKGGDQLALQPVLDAIGLRYGSGLTLHDRVVLVEGVSDLLYLRAFRSLLGAKEEIQIAPGRGDGSLLNIIPLIVAQDLRFKILIDVGTVVSKIKEVYLVPETAIYEVPIPEKFEERFDRSGIEDLFSKEDFRRILETCEIEVPKKEFEMTPNSYCIDDRVKTVLAKRVLETVRSGEIEFSTETKEAFSQALAFCDSDTWFRL